ncbi:GGDEF domain-containing protein [Cellulomonas cellasea]|uniref:GGDEF domain-containing protein n=1 Tax=Cellulomonas cellasea TaxID=43670 RepID=A0A4Y3KY18_9CELL|nr:GGDEF domain-containing protein [Cellulomonas cellasea]GEA87790.1 hypothetical protein CCE01nite_17390 [Cellulomonas cellasea]
MSWEQACRPRDPRGAARAAAVLVAVAALVTLVFTALGQGPSSLVALVLVTGVNLAVLPLAVALYRHGHRAPAATWLVTPVVGIAIIAGLDVATADASAAAQAFFAFPVVFAASQLGRKPVALVTVLAVLGNAWVVFTLLPPGRAATDLAYIGAMLTVLAAVLVQAGERQDRLVTRLTEQAAVDPLTGLATRRVLDDAAACALAQTGDGTGLMILDLDRFKVINDERGHPVGDDALAHVGDLLRRRAQAGTIASRLGGDEMALLLPGWGRQATLDVAEELLRLVRRTPLRGADGPVPLTVSIGVAHTSAHTTMRELYAAADAALYDAKADGRDRVVMTDDVSRAPGPHASPRASGARPGA